MWRTGPGERFFAQHLVDYDFASNNGGWQWWLDPLPATDLVDCAVFPPPEPFNPISQSEKFDADGAFIRQWVPELAKLRGKDLHDPSRIAPLLRSDLDYPRVDRGTKVWPPTSHRCVQDGPGVADQDLRVGEDQIHILRTMQLEGEVPLGAECWVPQLQRPLAVEVDGHQIADTVDFVAVGPWFEVVRPSFA